MRKSFAFAFRIAHSKGSVTFFILIQDQVFHPLAHDHPNTTIPLPLTVSILAPHILSDLMEDLQA
jgi:hypothetical protein